MTTLELMLLVFLGVATVALMLVAVLALAVICRMFGAPALPSVLRQEKKKGKAKINERGQVGTIEP